MKLGRAEEGRDKWGEEDVGRERERGKNSNGCDCRKKKEKSKWWRDIWMRRRKMCRGRERGVREGARERDQRERGLLLSAESDGMQAVGWDTIKVWRWNRLWSWTWWLTHLKDRLQFIRLLRVVQGIRLKGPHLRKVSCNFNLKVSLK